MHAEREGLAYRVVNGSGDWIGTVAPLGSTHDPFVALYLEGAREPYDTHHLCADGTPDAPLPGPDRPDLRRLGEFAPILDLAIEAGMELDPARVEASLWAVRVARWQSRAWGLGRNASWRDRARRVIVAVYEDVGTDDPDTLKRAIFDAYPFGPKRAHHPYKVWTNECKRFREAAAKGHLYLGDRPVRRRPDAAGQARLEMEGT